MLEAVPLPVRRLSAREWLLAEAADDAHHLAALRYAEVTAPAV
jgi:hypothetical protein